MASESKITIEFPPEMAEIIEKLRGELTPEQFVFLLLKIAYNPGSASRKPDFMIEEPEPRPDRPPF